MVSIVDGVLHHLGKPGGFHLLVTVLLCCNFFPITFHHLSIIFYGDAIAHTCRLPEGWPWHKKFSIPQVTVGDQSKYDQCHMFVDPNSANLGTKSCVYGWEFYPKDREWTIIAEWGLVCEREYLVTLASVVYHGGVMFGGLVFGTLADKFGRKPIMLFTLYVQTAISIGIYFVQNFILFVILRFVHGLLLQGLQCTTICLVMELLPMRYRTAAGMGCSIVWALAMISLSLVSYSVQHWRYIQLAVSLPCVVTFLYIWLIPESVRWLLTVMKTDNALVAARKFEQFNKRPLGEDFSKDVESATEQISSSVGHVESYGMRELLLQGSKLRINSLVLCFCWFSTSSLYHGLSMMLIEIGSSRYASTVIIGAVDLVAFVVMYFLLVRFGRKRPLCALLVVCGAVCISTVIAENLEKGDGLEVYVVSTVMALVERSCIAACLAGLTICAAELFPTVVRTFGIGVCLFCGQIGWIMAPQILKLGQFSMKSLPWIVFGILTLLAGLLVLLLPETLSKPLPDTLEDMESFESRKAAVKNQEKETAPAATASPTGYVDWKTTYKQKIEEANGSLGLGDGAVTVAAEEPRTEHAEKRWYSRNYSRRSAKVVRFYGLDCSEDPCQEVKTNKKQRIRMVRFSFESEEFCLGPPQQAHAPAPAPRRFSVIREEPELETAFDEDTAESSLEDVDEEEEVGTVPERDLPSSRQQSSGLDVVDPLFLSVSLDGPVDVDDPAPPSRFLVRRVSDSQVASSGCPKPDVSEDFVGRNSRFVVRRVSESKLTQTDALLADLTDCPDGLVEDLPRSVVIDILDACAVGGTVESERTGTVGSSRFTVRRVSESKLPQAALVQESGDRPAGDICVDSNLNGGPVVTASASRFVVRRVSESKLVSCAPGDVEGSPARGVDAASAIHDVSELKTSPSFTECQSPLLVSSPDILLNCNLSSRECEADVTGPPAAVGASRFTVRRVSESKLSPQLDPPRDVPQSQDCNAKEHKAGWTDSPALAATVNGGGKFADDVSEQPVSPRLVEAGHLETASRSRFSVQRVGEVGETADGDKKSSGAPLSSRFMVRRVSESKLSEPIGSSRVPSDGDGATIGVPAATNSRFTVRRVSESKLPPSVPAAAENGDSAASRFVVHKASELSSPDCHRSANGDAWVNGDVPSVRDWLKPTPTRFVVQRVADDTVNVDNLNNNNNNNDDDKLTNAVNGHLDKDGYENLQNMRLSNSSAVTANGTSSKLIVLPASRLDSGPLKVAANA